MAPTPTQLETQLQNAHAVLDNYLTQQTVPVDENAYSTSIDSDFSVEQQSSLANFEAAASAVLSLARSVVTPIYRAIARHTVMSGETDIQSVLDRNFRFWNDNSEFFQARGFTFATPPVFTGTGDGPLERLNVDEFGYPLEAQFADNKIVTCIQDANTGANRHEEIFDR